jgi:hypothetical protein
MPHPFQTEHGFDTYQGIFMGGDRWEIYHISAVSDRPSLADMFIYPPVPGEMYTFGAYCKDTGLSLTTNAGTFNHVVHLDRDFTAPYAKDSSEGVLKEIFFAPKTGIIKIKYQKNQVWQLVDYKIKK